MLVSWFGGYLLGSTKKNTLWNRKIKKIVHREVSDALGMRLEQNASDN